MSNRMPASILLPPVASSSPGVAAAPVAAMAKTGSVDSGDLISLDHPLSTVAKEYRRSTSAATAAPGSIKEDTFLTHVNSLFEKQEQEEWNRVLQQRTALLRLQGQGQQHLQQHQDLRLQGQHLQQHLHQVPAASLAILLRRESLPPAAPQRTIFPDLIGVDPGPPATTIGSTSMVKSQSWMNSLNQVKPLSSTALSSWSSSSAGNLDPRSAGSHDLRSMGNLDPRSATVPPPLPPKGQQPRGSSSSTTKVIGPADDRRTIGRSRQFRSDYSVVALLEDDDVGDNGSRGRRSEEAPPARRQPDSLIDLRGEPERRPSKPPTKVSILRDFDPLTDKLGGDPRDFGNLSAVSAAAPAESSFYDDYDPFEYMAAKAVSSMTTTPAAAAAAAAADLTKASHLSEGVAVEEATSHKTPKKVSRSGLINYIMA